MWSQPAANCVVYFAWVQTTWGWVNDGSILRCSRKKHFDITQISSTPRYNAFFLTDINICQYPVNELTQYLTWFLYSLVVLNWTGTGKDIRGLVWALFFKYWSVEDTCQEYLTWEYLSPLAAIDVTWLVLAMQESLLTSLVLAPSLLAKCAFFIYTKKCLGRVDLIKYWDKHLHSQSVHPLLSHTNHFQNYSRTARWSSTTANELGQFVSRLCSREHRYIYVDATFARHGHRHVAAPAILER